MATTKYYSQFRGVFSLEEGTLERIPAIGEHLSGGSSWHQAIANFTEYPIVLKSGYSTTANGSAEDIVCPPKANIRKLSNGGPRDFATYVIEPLQKIPDAFIYEVNFHGITNQVRVIVYEHQDKSEEVFEIDSVEMEQHERAEADKHLHSRENLESSNPCVGYRFEYRNKVASS